MRKRLLSCISLVLAVTLVLVGCGSEPGEENGSQGNSIPSVNSGETGAVYGSVGTLELEGETRLRLVQFVGQDIYSGGSSYDWDNDQLVFHLKKFSAQGELLEELSLSLGSENGSARFCMLDDGNFCVSTGLQADENLNLQTLFLFDAAGEPVWETSLAGIPELRSAGLMTYEIRADGQGRVYLLAGSRIFLFDSNGSYTGYAELEDGAEGWMLTRGGDGSVYTAYVSGRTNQILARINYDNQSVTAVGQDFVDCRSAGSDIHACGETAFFCNNGSQLWIYDMAAAERTLLFDWLDQDVKADEVRAVTGDADNILVLVNNRDDNVVQAVVLRPLTEEEIAERAANGPREIIITGTQIFYGIDDAAYAFNAAQKEYRVVLDPLYENAVDDWDIFHESVERLQRELVLGTRDADVVIAANLDLQALIEAGMVEDLSPYLEDSEVIKREDMFETVLDALTIDGKLYIIPQNFSISCIVGRTSDLGDRKEWTLREFLDFAEEHPNQRLFNSLDQESIMLSLANGDMFISERDGELVFEEAECREFLELIDSMKTLREEDIGSNIWMLQNGEALLMNASVNGYNGIQRIEAQFASEDLTYVGMPTAAGGSGMRVTPDVSVMFINSQSDCKEGAWAFLEYYLTNGDGLGGFPLLKEKFEEEVAEYLNPENFYEGSMGIGDWRYTFMPGTEREVEIIRELISRECSWTPASRNGDLLDNILSEEAVPYLQGQKDLDTVVDIIGSRWLLYHEENR